MSCSRTQAPPPVPEVATVTVTRQLAPVPPTPIAGTPLLPPGSGITVNPPVILALNKIYSTAIVSAPAPISIT